MTFSFIIPAHEYLDLTRNCLSSFYTHHGTGHEVIVVDDGSKPDTREQVKKICDEYGAKFLYNDSNLGFIRTVNKGMRAATGDVLVLTNNDIIFTRPVVAPFEKVFNQDPRIGIVGSLLFYPHGTVQHGGILRVGQYGFTHRGWHKRPENAPEVFKSQYMLAVTGALFGIRRQMYAEIGGMNEEYFISCDDTMYCFRAWQADWKVYYSGDIQAIHAEGGTRGNSDEIKMVKGRQWFLKEKETQGVFLSQIKHINFSDMDMKVARANKEALSARGAHPVSRFNRPAPPPLPKPEVFYEEVELPLNEKLHRLAECPDVIGINRRGALGDVILTTGIIRKIKEKFPDKKIIFSTICPDALRGNPHIDAIVPNKTDIPESASMVYDLDYAYEREPKMPIVSAYCEAILGESYPDLRPEMYSSGKDLNSALKYFGGSLPGRIAVLHMSVGWQNRTWPRHQWMSVVRGLVTQGYSVIVVGRGADYKADLFSNVFNVIDKLSISEIREVIKAAKVFVGMDSGILHVAQTTDTPIVGLFTCANPEYRVVRKEKVRVLVPKVECKFCLHDEKPPVTFVGCKRGDFKCLTEISPEGVVAAVAEVTR